MSIAWLGEGVRGGGSLGYFPVDLGLRWVILG